MLKNNKLIIAMAGVSASILVAPVAQSPLVWATTLPETEYTFNKPTEITITKIDLENNKFWVRILADGKTSGEANKYTLLNLLGVGADDGTRMTDEILSNLLYGRDYVGDSLLRVYNAQTNTTQYLPSEKAYEFTASRDIKLYQKQWYYWAPMAAPKANGGGTHVVAGRIDFSECADFIEGKSGYTCEVEDGEDGLYRYGPHDADGNRVLMPSEIIPEEPVEPIEPEDTGDSDGVGESDEPSELEEVNNAEGMGKVDGAEETSAISEPKDEKTIATSETKVVEKEVVVEKPIFITKTITTPVETVHYIHENSISETAEEIEDKPEAQVVALETAESVSEITNTEVEVPDLSGEREEKGFNFWWVVLLMLVATSLSFWLLACLKQSRTEEE